MEPDLQPPPILKTDKADSQMAPVAALLAERKSRQAVEDLLKNAMELLDKQSELSASLSKQNNNLLKQNEVLFEELNALKAPLAERGLAALSNEPLHNLEKRFS
jgi:hypothetical protein